MQRTDDAELVEATLAGDKDAYGTLYDRYAPLIRAVCYDYVRNVQDAQDLAQDVFLRAYTHLSQLRTPDCFGAWVVGMARLRCSEWRRGNARRHDRQAELGGVAPAASEPSDDEWEELRQTIADLPEKERLTLHVFYTLGKSADDACGIMGMSRSGFYRTLDRAKKRLRASLSRTPENVR